MGLLDDESTVINQAQLDHITDIVRRSVAAGARIVAGGTNDGLFPRPTVLAGVTADMPAFTEEIFGPVAVITTVRDDDKAVRLAHGTPIRAGGRRALRIGRPRSSRRRPAARRNDPHQ
jgi:benzaldehyde dehydrogenase (NAD)